MKIKWNVTFSHGWWPSMNNSSARNQIKTLTKFVSNVCGRASRDRSWNSIGISQKNSHSLWRSFIDLNWNCKKMLHFLRAPVVPYRWNLAPSAVVSWLCGLEWMNLCWADSIRCYRLWSAVLPGPQEKEEIWMNELEGPAGCSDLFNDNIRYAHQYQCWLGLPVPINREGHWWAAVKLHPWMEALGCKLDQMINRGGDQTIL